MWWYSLMKCQSLDDFIQKKSIEDIVVIIATCIFRRSGKGVLISVSTQIAIFMGPTWGHLGPVSPRCAPCRPRESCCQGKPTVQYRNKHWYVSKCGNKYCTLFDGFDGSDSRWNKNHVVHPLVKCLSPWWYTQDSAIYVLGISLVEIVHRYKQ